MENPYDWLEPHEGEIFTYRQLCDLLGEQLKRGKAKELHLNVLRQYLDLDQKTVPRKIVLQRVYSEDDIKITGGKGRFLPFIKNLLLRKLQDKGTLVMTYAELVEELGLAPDQYMRSRYDKATDTISIKDKFKNSVETLSLSRVNQENFFAMSWTIIREILRSSLRQMEAKELIQVTYSRRLLRKESFIDNQGETIEYMQKRNLNPEEYEQFVEIGESVIKQFNLSGLQELFYRKTGRGIKEAQETYKTNLDLFIKNLDYTDSATLLSLSLTSKGEKFPIDERYLDETILQDRIKEKIIQEDDLKKVIAAPALEELIRKYL